MKIVNQQKLEKILYKLKLTLNLLFPEIKMYYTFTKGENMKWPLVTSIFWHILGMYMYEPVFP
jgi:hypothetical protein